MDASNVDWDCRVTYERVILAIAIDGVNGGDHQIAF